MSRYSASCKVPTYLTACITRRSDRVRYRGQLARWLQHRAGVAAVGELFPLALQCCQRTEMQVIVVRVLLPVPPVLAVRRGRPAAAVLLRTITSTVLPAILVPPVRPAALIVMLVWIRTLLNVGPIQARVRIGRRLRDGFIRRRAIAVAGRFAPTRTVVAHRVFRSGAPDKLRHAAMFGRFNKRSCGRRKHR